MVEQAEDLGDNKQERRRWERWGGGLDTGHSPPLTMLALGQAPEEENVNFEEIIPGFGGQLKDGTRLMMNCSSTENQLHRGARPDVNW